MINVITELSKYVILTLMIVYTFHCFYMVWRQDEEEKKELLHQQLTMIFFIDFTAFLVFGKIHLETDRLFYLSFNFPHIQSINKLCKNFYLFF